jgi:hypothetical protein
MERGMFLHKKGARQLGKRMTTSRIQAWYQNPKNA